MKNFIWDLDGTLFDSYEVIIEGLYQTSITFGCPKSKQELLEYVKKESVNEYVKVVSKLYNIDPIKFKKYYSDLTLSMVEKVTLIEGTEEIIKFVYDTRNNNFIVTHRGKSTYTILNKYGLTDCFKEIITSDQPFPRKPDPSAINYLIEKYHLDRNATFYVGDRVLDIECGKNANIKTILYLPSDAPVEINVNQDYTVQKLIDIKKLID